VTLYELQTNRDDVAMPPKVAGATVEYFVAQGAFERAYAVLRTDSSELFGDWCDALKKRGRPFRTVDARDGARRDVNDPDW